MAIGYGMELEHIFNSCPSQFYFELEGYIQRNHHDWERTRLEIFWLASAAGAKIKSPRDIVSTVFDNRSNPDIDPESIREWGKAMAKRAGWKLYTNDKQ